MKSIKSVDPFIIRLMHNIAAVALTVMMLAVVGDVLLRTLFNAPLQGSYDIVSFSLLIMTMFGMAVVVAKRGEILIDLIDSVLPPFALRLLAIASAVSGIALFVFFAWAMTEPALDAWSWGEQSLELGIPKWPLWAAAFVGLLGILLGYVLQLRAAVKGDVLGAPIEEGEL